MPIQVNKVFNANVYLDGDKSLVGRASEVALPDIEMAMNEHTGLGMVGSLEVPQRLLHRDAGDVVEPAIGLLLLQLGEGLRGVAVVEFFTLFECLCSEPEPPVVGEPTATEDAREEEGLLWGGVESEAESELHSMFILDVCSVVKAENGAPPRPEGRGLRAGRF